MPNAPRFFNAHDYGLVGDGVTDDTAAFQALAAAVDAAGGGEIWFPPGKNYKVLPNGPGTLCQFTDCHGLRIIGTGSTITSTHTFSSTVNGVLFDFRNCTDLMIAPPACHMPLYPSTPLATGAGMLGLVFRPGCRDITIPSFEMTGGGGAVMFVADNNGVTTGLYRNVTIGLVHATSCGYGITGAYGPDNLVVENLVTDGIKRSFFIYGAKNVFARIRSKNPSANDVMIGSYGGRGCENVEVHYTLGTDTTAMTNQAHNVNLFWGDATPAAFRNLKFDFNIEYSAEEGANTGRGALIITKYSASGTGYDGEDRGHILENLTICGTIKGIPSYLRTYIATPLIGTQSYINGGGAPNYCVWGTGDHWRNIRFENLTITGVTEKPAIVITCAPVEDQVVLSNVTVDGGWIGLYETDANPVPPLTAEVVCAGVKALNVYDAFVWTLHNSRYYHALKMVHSSSTSIGTGWRNRVITNKAAHFTGTLPALSAAILGYTFWFHKMNATNQLRATPAGTDTILDPGTGSGGRQIHRSRRRRHVVRSGSRTNRNGHVPVAGDRKVRDDGLPAMRS